MHLSRIGVARAAISLAFLVSLLSLSQTFSHLRDPEYYLPSLSDGPEHARFHFLRELMGDAGKIIAVCIILAQPDRRRRPTLWWIMAVLAASYYGGFWIGYPTLGVGAPNTPARMVHTIATVLGLSGVLVARPCFSDAALSSSAEHDARS